MAKEKLTNPKKSLDCQSGLGNSSPHADQPKNIHAVALGRLGGRIGGKSTSEAKRAASRRNGKLNKGKRGVETNSGV
jgi:hypothetical protein